MRQEAAGKLSEDDITDYAKKKLEKARADARALQVSTLYSLLFR